LCVFDPKGRQFVVSVPVIPRFMIEKYPIKGPKEPEIHHKRATIQEK
jgi:hypothetical protein